MEVNLFNDLLTLTVDLVAGRSPVFLISPKEGPPDQAGTPTLTPDRGSSRKRPKDGSSSKTKKSRNENKALTRGSTDGSVFQGSTRNSSLKFSTQELDSPRNSFSVTMGDKSGRNKKNMSVEGGRDRDKARGRKVKSARQSATQSNEFYPNEIDKRPNGELKERRKRLRSRC